ncbi:MAG: B12-binding domain-containing protein, partial [bacterium]
PIVTGFPGHATLRTWDRRYGLGPTQHAAGSHRRYTLDDIARLELMRRHVLAGVPAADAARAARESVDPARPESVEPPAPTSRPGGGRVVPIPGGTPSARGLARAATALDADACREIVGQTLDRRGVVWTWDHLIVPVLVGVGQKWETTGQGIEVEHVLSEAIQSEFSARVASAERRSSACVLLAAVEGELHVLPLWALAAGLAERHVETRMLGPRTPACALSEAMRRLGPGGVVLWSQLPETASAAQLAQLPDMRPEPLVLLAGPGWRGSEPVRGERVDDLSEAIALLARAAGA